MFMHNNAFMWLNVSKLKKNKASIKVLIKWSVLQ